MILLFQIRSKDALNAKLEQDLRLLKKFHDEQFEQHIQTTASNIDQLQSEIRTLKRVCEEKSDEVSFYLNHRIKLELKFTYSNLSQ